MFGRKAKAIAELSAEVKLLKWKLDLAESNERTNRDRVMSLGRVVREQDQLAFQMNSCTSWEAMRPNFQKLLLGVNARMQNESERIKGIMMPELEQTYGPGGMAEHASTYIPSKQIEDKR